MLVGHYFAPAEFIHQFQQLLFQTKCHQSSKKEAANKAQKCALLFILPETANRHGIKV
jgi:hypothetical protein